nr:virulence RhuM family protein [Thiothrix caldifontis]
MAVGYHVNSAEATQFRISASLTLTGWRNNWKASRMIEMRQHAMQRQEQAVLNLV